MTTIGCITRNKEGIFFAFILLFYFPFKSPFLFKKKKKSPFVENLALEDMY